MARDPQQPCAGVRFKAGFKSGTKFSTGRRLMRRWRERWSRVNTNGRFRPTANTILHSSWQRKWEKMTCQRCVLTVSRRSRARRNWQLFISYTPVPPRGPRREDRMAKLIGNFGFAWETKVGARFKFLLFARRILSDRSTNSTYRDRCHDTVILSGEFLHFPGADKSVVNGSGCREDVGEEGWFLSRLHRIKVRCSILRMESTC